MNSLEIRLWKEELVKKINEANLPLEVKRMALMEILVEVEKACNQEIYEIQNSMTGGEENGKGLQQN